MVTGEKETKEHKVRGVRESEEREIEKRERGTQNRGKRKEERNKPINKGEKQVH